MKTFEKERFGFGIFASKRLKRAYGFHQSPQRKECNAPMPKTSERNLQNKRNELAGEPPH
jgi:hypothetical protein